MKSIYIVPVKTSEDLFLEALVAGIMHAFGLTTEIIHPDLDIEKNYDQYRRQYNSSRILFDILNNRPADTLRILGIADVDLFIPILTFVFGEAQLDGIGALVSTHRLNNRFYGLPYDSELLIRRLVKESIHEIGHTFGIIHCSYPGCVMNRSTYVEDIDQKSDKMCAHCRTDLDLYFKTL